MAPEERSEAEEARSGGDPRAAVREIRQVPGVAELMEHAASEESPDEPCHCTVGAIASIAKASGIVDLSLTVGEQDFAALRAELSSEEREEQARRWGGGEMRFRTCLGWTRVVERGR